MEKDRQKEKELFEKYLKPASCRLSAFSYVYVDLWRDFFEFEFQVIDENLCVFASDDLGKFLYLPPLGPTIRETTLEKCFALMRERDGTSNGVARIENVDASRLRFFDPSTYRIYRKSHEYVYYREDIAGLYGNAYKSKRSDINHFRKKYESRIASYTDEHKEECLALYDAWAGRRKETLHDEVGRQMIDENRCVLARLLAGQGDLALIGRVVFVDGQMKAFTFGYALNEDIFCILFEIADVTLKGLPVYIFREFCWDEGLRRYKFINAMDDFALPNIAQTKMSFRPRVLCPVYTVSLKDS